MSQTNPPHKLRFAILATDVVLFTVEQEALKVLLIPINRPPHYKNAWGVPGGLIRPTETAEEAVVRILKEKGSMGSHTYLEQLCTFSEIHRDPRGRVVSVAYLGLVPSGMLSKEGREKYGVRWRGVGELPRLAFDHTKMIRVAVK